MEASRGCLLPLVCNAAHGQRTLWKVQCCGEAELALQSHPPPPSPTRTHSQTHMKAVPRVGTAGDAIDRTSGLVRRSKAESRKLSWNSFNLPSIKETSESFFFTTLLSLKAFYYF